MPRLIFLGTAAAVPDEQHENTHLALLGEKRQVLVDCPGSPTIRLRQAGIPMTDLTDVILTHFHPDHVSGMPSLLVNSWLTGRKAPLQIHGLASVLERLQRLMDDFDWRQWPNFFEVVFHPVPADRQSVLLEDEAHRILAAPVAHSVPALGLRIETTRGVSLAYSGDTAPCDAMRQLAAGVDILIHEATGEYSGHTSPAQAGKLAREAQARRLYLVHYPPMLDQAEMLSQAQEAFGAPVILAQDFMQIEI